VQKKNSTYPRRLGAVALVRASPGKGSRDRREREHGQPLLGRTHRNGYWLPRKSGILCLWSCVGAERRWPGRARHCAVPRLAFASSSASCVLSRLSGVLHFWTSPRPCESHAHLLRGSSSIATRRWSKDSLSDAGAVIREGSSHAPPRPAAARVQPHRVLPPDTTILPCLASHTVVTGGGCLIGLSPATHSGACRLASDPTACRAADLQYGPMNTRFAEV